MHSTIILFAVAIVAFVFGFGFKRLANLLKRRDTETHAARLEAEMSAEQLRAIVKASLDGIIIIDDVGKIVEFSESAEKIFGYDRKKVIGMPMGQLIIPERYRQAHRAGLERMRNSGEPRILGKRIEIEAVRSTGEEFMSELAVSRSRSSSGDLFISYIRDISENKKAENALKEAKSKAEEANEVKSKFLAAMSHEIRTPFNAVLGILELLQDTDVNDDQKRLIDTAGNSTKALLQVINDTLDYAKVTAGKLSLKNKTFDMSSLLQETIDLFLPVASEKDLDLVSKIDLGDHVYLEGDSGRLRQVIINLVGNAIKFTHEGSVTIDASTHRHEDGHVEFQCNVIDTGIGISDQKKQHLFDEFFMVDDGDTREYEGTGLGLSISHKLIELMQGEIGVDSVEGEGSKFWISVPLDVSASTAPAEVERKNHSDIDLSGMKILLAEDNKTNQMVLGRMLDKHECSVTIAANGVEALKHLTTNKFDVVLMDISMPIMGGLKATQIIREPENSFNNIPIIALTAIATNDDTETFLEAGMDAVLTKPVARFDLVHNISEIVNGKRNGSEQVDPEENNMTFNTETLEDLFGDISKEELDVFKTQLRLDLESTLSDLGAGVENSDKRIVEKASHTLKGLAATYGMDGLSTQAHLTNSYTLNDSNGDWVHAAKRSIENGKSVLTELDDVFSEYLGNVKG